MTTFRYPIIIYDTTRERVFQALTNRADMDIYLDKTGPESTWEVGEKIYWKSEPGDDYEDLDQVVLDVTAPETLSFTWHQLEDTELEGTEREDTVVRYDLTDIDFPGAIQVTLTHSGFRSEDSPMYQQVQHGWIMILSSLKTYLESGDADRNADE